MVILVIEQVKYCFNKIMVIITMTKSVINLAGYCFSIILVFKFIDYYFVLSFVRFKFVVVQFKVGYNCVDFDYLNCHLLNLNFIIIVFNFIAIQAYQTKIEFISCLVIEPKFKVQKYFISVEIRGSNLDFEFPHFFDFNSLQNYLILLIHYSENSYFLVYFIAKLFISNYQFDFKSCLHFGFKQMGFISNFPIDFVKFNSYLYLQVINHLLFVENKFKKVTNIKLPRNKFSLFN